MRRTFALFSIVFHAVLITTLLVAQVLAVGTLPTPSRPLVFENIQFVKVAEVPLPAATAPRAVHERGSGASVSANAAPTVAPTSVTRETGNEGPDASAPPIDTAERGPGVGIVGTLLRDGAPPAPPPEPPRARAPVHLHSGIAAPVKVAGVSPVYPVIAQGARVEGVVILEAVIDAQGRVASATVLRSIPLLDQAAVDAVRQWRFTPARLNGEAVPVVMTVTVHFTLRDR